MKGQLHPRNPVNIRTVDIPKGHRYVHKWVPVWNALIEAFHQNKAIEIDCSNISAVGARTTLYDYSRRSDYKIRSVNVPDEKKLIVWLISRNDTTQNRQDDTPTREKYPRKQAQ